ncbi:MAG: hypothetical protein R6T92_02310 [Desulfosalsimonadaceae bacterium]
MKDSPTFKSVIMVGVCLLALWGCGSLSPIEPVAPGVHEEIDRRCRAHFLHRPWQLVQAITAYTPDGEVQNAIGVIRMYPGEERIQCVITSVEGIVLFDGEYDQKTVIRRGIGPFADETFANTLFDDIRLVFFHPDEPADVAGQTSSEAPVCRYERGDGFVEVLFSADRQREIKRYNTLKKLRKTIHACYEARCSRHITEATEEIPAKLTISHHGLLEYRLELELIDAKKLPP